MPRPLRSDVSGTIYHALNLGNSRNDIFFKQADDALFDAQFCARRRDRGANNDYLFLTKNLPSLFWLFVETRI